jgi:porphobilinogen deaminase
METNDRRPDLTVRVDPSEMVQYVHDLMTAPRGKGTPESSAALAERQWGGDTALARAAQIRWMALNRAFGDVRVSPWTSLRKRDQLHVPAALIAAAGVARLKVAEDEVVFDIPTLLDATLELCEPVGNA